MGILEIRSGKDGISFLILEFQHRRLADRLNGLVRILDAGKLNDDTPLPFPLNDRLCQTKLIHALFHDAHNPLHSIVIDLCLGSVLRFQDNMRAALKIQSLTNGIRQGLHEGNKYTDGHNNAGNELYETILSQLLQPFPFQLSFPMSEQTR